MSQRSNEMQSRLIALCKKGDRKAQYEIYQKYSVAMFNTALRIVGNREEAEDMIQESFLDAFLKIESFRGDSTFGAWLKRIVVNKSINLVKKRKMTLVEIETAELNGNGIHTDPSPEAPAPSLSVESVLKAMEDLPDGYRIVFSLYCIEGYDHREISGILGISESGSKSQLNRAKKKLKEILNEKTYV